MSNGPLTLKDLPTDPNEKALLKTQTAPDIENPSGIETKFHIHDDNITVQRTRDVQSTLDSAARLRFDGATKSKTGEFYHIARLDKIIIEKYCNDKGINFHEFCVNDEHITKILNDPQYKNFRVWDGSV